MSADHKLHAFSKSSLEENTRCVRTTNDGEIPTRCYRVQKCRCRTGSPMAADCEVIAAHTKSRVSIEIRITRKSKLVGRLKPGITRGIPNAQIGYLEFSGSPVKLALTFFITFVPFEKRKHALKIPSARAQPLPTIKAYGLPPYENQSIDR
jgi:hypothetical protein